MKTDSFPIPTALSSPLALLGGTPVMEGDFGDLFQWPIITPEDEAAALAVIRAGTMSGTAETKLYEQEFSQWMGVRYALAFNNGTASLLAAMFACGLGVGDELICPAITYWASALQCYSLGATVVFADIDPQTLCIDPRDIERHISPRTKAIVAVHYLGHPCDMDAIMAIARKHGLKVIEDVSHAQGALYKGRKVGSIGDVSGYSLMAGKSLVSGEGGMLTTNDREIYERAVAFGHYERHNSELTLPDLKAAAGLPLGGIKGRMHQVSAAVGRVQLRHYDARTAEIRKSINYFWELLEGTPGLAPHRIHEAEGSHMGGWYMAHGLYRPDELGGLSVARFAEAVRAEGVAPMIAGCNLPLHLHPVFNDVDIYGHGRPTRIAHSERDLRQPPGSLPIAEQIGSKVYLIPWFKHYRPEWIERHAEAFRKVALHADELLVDDPGNGSLGGWNLFTGSAS